MSLATAEATDLVGPGGIPRETAEKVVRYLVFHRSLLGENEDTGPVLERYLTLVRNLKDGVHLVIPDPFQRATALLFELVMEEEFDPWEIDLVKFTQAYLDRVHAEGDLNFTIAGRLVYMAWSILYLQSEAILRTRDTPDPPADGSPELMASDVTDEGYLPLLTSPEAVDVTSAVLGSADPPPLLEMVRHPETRPVSLLELVRAFGEAEADARRSLRIQELRERLREEQRAPPEVLVHGDVPEHDLTDTWEAVRHHPVGQEFPMLELWNPLMGRDRLVAVFLALLFLARERSVELHQETLGSSPVLVVRTAEARATVAEKE
jgi:segregation and condensation protein A